MLIPYPIQSPWKIIQKRVLLLVDARTINICEYPLDLSVTDLKISKMKTFCGPKVCEIHLFWMPQYCQNSPHSFGINCHCFATLPNFLSYLLHCLYSTFCFLQKNITDFSILNLLLSILTLRGLLTPRMFQVITFIGKLYLIQKRLS